LNILSELGVRAEKGGGEGGKVEHAGEGSVVAWRKGLWGSGIMGWGSGKTRSTGLNEGAGLAKERRAE